MSFSSQRKNAIDALTNINRKVIHQPGLNLSSVFLGGSEDTWHDIILQKNATHASVRFMTELFSDSTTAKDVSLKLKQPMPLSVNVLMSGASQYTTYTQIDSVLSSDSTELKPNVVDINFYSFIDQANTVGQEFAAMLQKLYLTHDLFSVTNWSKIGGNNMQDIYLQGCRTDGVLTKVRLLREGQSPSSLEYDVCTTRNADLTSAISANRTPVVSIVDLENMDDMYPIPLRTLAKDRTLNTLPFRRLIYLWVRMANFRLSVFSKLGENKGQPWKKPCYMLLERDNKQTDMNAPFMMGDDSNAGLLDALQSKENVFRQTTGIINDLSSDITEQQKAAKATAASVQDERITEHKVKIFEYTSFSVLICVFIGAVIVASHPSMDSTTKVKTSIGIFGMTVLASLVMVFVYRNTGITETFAEVYYTDGTASTSFMANVKTFLQTTTTLTTMLTSYDMATNMNRAVQKDYAKYRVVNKELVVVNRKLDGINRYAGVSKTERSSRMYLFVFLALLLATMLPLYNMAASQPMLRTAVVVILGTLSVIAIALHSYQVTSIVRTDGNKKYWTPPKV